MFKNGDDLDRIVTHFSVDDNDIIDASEFCNKDELPRIETLLANISTEKKKMFSCRVDFIFKILRRRRNKKYLVSIINMTISGHVVVMTYQCEKQLNFSDPRLSRSICLIDGDETSLPPNSLCVEGTTSSFGRMYR